MDSSTGDPVWRSDSPTARIAIIAALELEAGIPRRLRVPPCPMVYVSGPGRERARIAAERAITDGAEAILSWGLAGGLKEAAQTGTVLLPEAVISAEGQWPSDRAWRERLALALAGRFSVNQQPLVSTERILTTRQEKSKTASESGASAVDMESAAIAQVATEHGVAFVVLRVVADGPRDELPDNVETLVTADGHTRLRGLLGMVTSLRRLHLLLALARHSQAARRQLGAVIQELVRSAR
jgi:adenosylhomocysteine nucleosidase